MPADQSQADRPAALQYAMALLPVVRELSLPEFGEPWAAKLWLQNQLFPAIVSQDPPPHLAADAVGRLLEIAADRETWDVLATHLQWLIRDEHGSPMVASIAPSALTEIAHGLVDALRQVIAEHLPPPMVDITADYLDAPGRDTRPLYVCNMQNEPLSETAEWLIKSGRAFSGAACAESPIDPYLQSMATDHARYMARACRGGHQHFSRRFKMVLDRYGQQTKCSEIAAESWKHEDGKPLSAIGTSMWKSWKYSSGHWRVASKLHEAMGAEMARGRNGVWYAAILVIDGSRTTTAEREAQHPAQ